MKSVLIIDAFGLFFRAFYATPNLKTPDGKPSSMVFGLCSFLLRLEQLKSDYVFFALEGGDNFRKKIDPNYKANRTRPPDELLNQLEVCIKMLEQSGIKCLSVEGFEADDIIASLCKKLPDYEIKIFSSDKDLYQLINPNCSLIDPKTYDIVNEVGCLKKFGLKPTQIKDFLAICGDSADNIKGIKGIGAKGAKDLLEAYENIDNIYQNLTFISNTRAKNALINGKEDLELSLKLVSLYENALDDLSVDEILKNANFPNKNPLYNLENYLKEYALASIHSRLKTSEKKEELCECIVLDEIGFLEQINMLNDECVIGFDCESTGLERDCDIVGFSFCVDEKKSFYVPLSHKNYDKNVSFDVAKSGIRQIFNCFVVGHNLKFDFALILRVFGIKPPKKYKDTMILAYLDEPESKVGLDYLLKKHFNFDVLEYEKIVPKGSNFSDVPINTATNYAAKDAFGTFKLYFFYLKKLDDKLLSISDFECDFIKVLLSMEKWGIKIDADKLKEFSKYLQNELVLVESEIFELAQTMFNINSPKQLSNVLFDKMGIKSPTKKQSTNEAALSQITHPIAEKILKYREIAKLINTYCEPFLRLASENDGRIFTHFLQTRTATGRLASNEPNLQNLPSRGTYARDYKKCFIAQNGYSFLSLDYSQIELRLLAHFSEEKTLIRAFLDNLDIHAQTAISIFGECDEEKRQIAKSINFGLIYGMGYKKLSQELQIEPSLAKEYIKRYFERFSGLYDFFESVRTNTQKCGFITTLLGRKRFFDYANATPMLRASFDRESVNSILQGSAADIIKMAMLKILPSLDDEKRMILQIHDELIFEIKDELIDDFSKYAKEIMENVFSLKIPLKTSLDIAKSWGEL